jgi:DNA-binding Xre family transcriptional regulator
MKVSYKRLWKLLIDKEIKKQELMKMSNVGGSTMTKLSKGENVNLDILVRICTALECDLHDVVELVPDAKLPDVKHRRTSGKADVKKRTDL